MKIEELPTDKKIVLFDGVCNLCDEAVHYIIRYDKKDIFRFVSLQSELGQTILNHLGITTLHIDSIVLYERGIAYFFKSEAALEIAKELSGLYFFSVLFRIFPVFFRDMIYDYIAKNRYKWYGKKEKCLVPTTELKNKFLA
jgi:predicted DCC family thiol-disulfide oxidoreductase YuxK